MNNSTIISIIVALTAAFTSLIVAVVNHFSTKKNAHDLETFKTKLTADLTKELDSFRADIAEKQAEKNARRDYLYEARKRLYQEYEPLLFQLVELSRSALARIYGLARTAKQGNLGAHHNSWLSPDNSSYDYYSANTIYRFLAPLVIIKLIQRRLTLVDLTVDPHINNQYLLANCLYHTFTQDFTLANIKPRIEYDPNNKVWSEKRETHPEKYWRQGIVGGRLDNAVEALIIREPNGILRCMSFGEFEDVYTDSNRNGKFDIFRDVFLEFHPKTRPVLWRLLIAQAHIYQALMRTHELKILVSDESLAPKLLKSMSEEDRMKLDWRQESEEATIKYEEVLNQPFEVAVAYLRESLSPLFIL